MTEEKIKRSLTRSRSISADADPVVALKAFEQMRDELREEADLKGYEYGDLTISHRLEYVDLGEAPNKRLLNADLTVWLTKAQDDIFEALP